MLIFIIIRNIYINISISNISNFRIIIVDEKGNSFLSCVSCFLITHDQTH